MKGGNALIGAVLDVIENYEKQSKSGKGLGKGDAKELAHFIKGYKRLVYNTRSKRKTTWRRLKR